MNPLKPLSFTTTFTFVIPAKHLSAILETVKSRLFEDVEMSRGINGINIKYKLSTTIQGLKLSQITSSYIVRLEKRFRDDFFNRLSFCKSDMIDLKEKSNISFYSGLYSPSN